MNKNDLARIITLMEGKKVSINIAQVKEVLKCLNEFTEGEFYKWIKPLEL